MINKLFYTTIILLVFSLIGCVTVPQNNEAYQSHIDLSMAYLSQNDIANAQNAYAKANSIDPNNNQTLLVSALISQYANKNDEADIKYEKLIAKDPDYATAHNNYGVFLFQQSQLDKAIIHFRLAAENPNYDKRIIAWSNLGNASIQIGNTKLASEAYDMAIKIADNNAQLRLQLAQLHYEQKNWLLANNSLLRYIQISDENKQLVQENALNLGIEISKMRNDLATISYLEERKEQLKLKLEN